MRSVSLENSDAIRNSWPLSCKRRVPDPCTVFRCDQYRRRKNETQSGRCESAPRAGSTHRNHVVGKTAVMDDWRVRAKNKCGPGQPPGPHCFREIPFAPGPRTRHGGEQPCSPTLRRVRATMLLGRLSLAKRTSRINLQHCGGASGQSCRVWRTLEEAATPGQPVRAETRSWRNPPGDSPSRIIRNRWLCRNALAGHAGISLE